MLLVLLCSLVLIFANFSSGEIRKYFSIGFKKSSIDRVDIENGIVFFSTVQKYLILSGILGTIIGMIAMLAQIEDPKQIGRGMSLALLTVLYAIIFSMAVVTSFKTGLQKRLNETEK